MFVYFGWSTPPNLWRYVHTRTPSPTRMPNRRRMCQAQPALYDSTGVPRAHGLVPVAYRTSTRGIKIRARGMSTSYRGESTSTRGVFTSTLGI